MGYQLKWVGGPGQFIPNVPAADIEVAGLAEAAYLVHGGAYSSEDKKVLARVEEIRAEGREEAPPAPDVVDAPPEPPAATDPGRVVSEGDPLAPA